MAFWVECDLCGAKAPHFPEIVGEAVPAQWHTGVAGGLACELDVAEICPECIKTLRLVIRFWKPMRAVALDLLAKEPDCNLSEDERAARRLVEPILNAAKYGPIYPGGKKIE